MNRAELEALDREDLIVRAEAAGVTRARILTRPELVDELLLRSITDQTSRQRSRGLFGRARDLLASVVERGLNLPDAAERIRAVGEAMLARPSAPAALPTVTLAEIYAAQGHRERAIETLDRVLVREPDHSAAQTLVTQLRDDSYPLPPPRMPPEPEEEAVALPLDGPGEPALDASPARSDVDECVAIPLDPGTLHVHWEVRHGTLEYLRAARPGGALALRAVVVVPTWDGPRSTLRDHEVHDPLGDHVVRGLPRGSVVRAAIGYRVGDAFVAVAHSPALEAPEGASPLVADVLLRWTPQGTVRVAPTDRDAAAIERALGRARLEASASTTTGEAGRSPPGERSGDSAWSRASSSRF